MGKTIIIRKVVEDITPSESEKLAEIEAKERLELLGVVSCHAKKPSRRGKTREVKYGRGKTFHADIHSAKWKDYCDGRITLSQLKSSISVQEGKALKLREKPEWMLRLEKKAAADRAERPCPKPVLDI